MRGLPLDSNARPSWALSRILRLFPVVLLLAAGFLLTSRSEFFAERVSSRDFFKLPVTCPAQSPAISPLLPFAPVDADYPSTAAVRLSGAIRVRTETFDASSSNGSDPSYDKFGDFEGYLRKTYPTMFHFFLQVRGAVDTINSFKSLKLEHIASHGLLFTWQGSDASLSPIILMAHQDTVPVPENTVERWTHPPFEGHFDENGWIWGRGGGDCKNLLIGELSAVDELLRIGFKPQRTVLLSFGFDEEGGRVRSASHLSAHVESIYGKDSVLFIIDEGEGIKEDYFGRTFITPALGEKGSANIEVTVAVPGGHSSVPPVHTGIGILSELVTTIENHPFYPKLSTKNPFSAYAQCLAEHSDIDPALKKALSHERTWDKAAAMMAAKNAGDGARLMTTQAVDIIHGGVKVNALPEQATAIVNHRISVDSSVKEIQQRYLELLNPVAHRFNLTVVDFDSDVPETATRYLKLSTPYGSEASPVSPYSGSAWDIFSGTARHLWGEDAIIAPLLMNGGTDTRAFQNLSRAIYRFEPLRSTDKYDIHTVNERIHIDGHLNTIRWVFALIQNADAFRE
ncbi:putative Gly-X carboxypeptidase [Mycena venus]|uniref:Putative Gly-X carboxypeptidase n=1 Tax=Mycena venus TaxID=2733690 RepID=A0A8H6YIE2_9AGAR|nr:putative Gly-X carboxypeptidase [Mycena venus]